MKISRFFQSCLLIEDNDTRILIDSSSHDAENYDNFGKLDAVLFTHEHPDHFDAELAQKFMDSGVAAYVNESTAKHMKTQANVVKDGQEFQIKNIKVRARELPHCLMVDGSQGPQNTGYLINGKLFHSGDGVSIENLNTEILAAPISGPDVSLHDAHAFAMQTSAKVFIPIHYDIIGTKPEVFAMFSARTNPPYEVKVIHHNQGLEL
jgi:L-ascorbate metabolism protein UlaG (beta-lactamase superfamily)